MGGGFALLGAPRYDFAAASVNYGEVPSWQRIPTFFDAHLGAR